MREILFRGRRKDYVPKPDDPKWMYWVYGDLVHNGLNSEKAYIKPIGNAFRISATESGLARLVVLHEVDPATIGQYTGLKDCDGKRIFEGDILQFRPDVEEYEEYKEYSESLSEVCFGEFNCGCCEGVYGWELDGCGDIRHFIRREERGPYRVVGNIHDNQDLMGEE